MIQIYGLRGKGQTLFGTAPSVEELFAIPDKFLNQIPDAEKWNLFFTVHDCKEEGERAFTKQSILPIDIDHADLNNLPATIDAVCEPLGLEKEKTGIACSGNGLQFFVKLPYEIEDEDFFEEKRLYYKAICQKINENLKKHKLLGTADPAVWSKKRLMRMPGTLNKKAHGERQAYMINGTIEPFGFDLIKASGLPDLGEKDQVSKKVLKRFDLDTKAVCEGCEFLKHCKEKQSEISEPQWYALVSVLSYLDTSLVHEYSKEHAGYSPDETNRKIEQALEAAGPRTCSNINTLWDGCKTCVHHETDLVSPILIEGPNHIKSKRNGFYNVVIDKETGKVKKTRPNYEDLMRFFTKQHPFYVAADGIYVWQNKFWREINKGYVVNFAEEHFEPKPASGIRNEFAAKIEANNWKENDWKENAAGKINLQNGIFDIAKNELLEHSTKYAFYGILPYAYDATASAPVFEKFMRDVTGGDKEIEQVLLEFAGYCISGDDLWLHKSLVLSGEGSNGKSTFMSVLRALVGSDLYASLSLTALNDPAKRHSLVNRLFNLGEETHVSALSKSEVFKTMVSGGEIDVKKLYAQPFSIRNKAKLIFACNKLPYSNDQSEGLYRRLVIIPFRASFVEGDNEDKFIDKKLLSELPGILNILIRSYKNLRERGRLPDSKSVSQEAAKFRVANNTALAWFEECVELTDDQNSFVTTDELYTQYQNFCQKRGEKYPFRYDEFSKELRKVLPKTPDRNVQRSANGHRKRGYICLKIEQQF